MFNSLVRCELVGEIKVLPIYLFFTNPLAYGIPDALAYPKAASRPESGTPMTRSAFTVSLLAKNSPHF